ncbi:hypothetical protein TBK1r_15890 [Stieleria magnilauensis]|uniref:Uncharacterized protein n=1 Tax=Stieleria magnilauensis TaxID=2527963 RepID=A0ABX5XL01_9BACT|nr:hypothetical protein TBK1r_15890 [Planctomycetes bacterium TBK1r]
MHIAQQESPDPFDGVLGDARRAGRVHAGGVSRRLGDSLRCSSPGRATQSKPRPRFVAHCVGTRCDPVRGRGENWARFPEVTPRSPPANRCDPLGIKTLATFEAWKRGLASLMHIAQQKSPDPFDNRRVATRCTTRWRGDGRRAGDLCSEWSGLGDARRAGRVHAGGVSRRLGDSLRCSSPGRATQSKPRPRLVAHCVGTRCDPVRGRGENWACFPEVTLRLRFDHIFLFASGCVELARL